MYDQIKILTSKEQYSGFLDVYKYVPSYMYSCILFFKCQNVSEEEIPEPYNSNQGRNLQKHLYQKIKVNDVAIKYDIPANTIFTWKKHADKYLREAGQISSKRKQNITSS